VGARGQALLRVLHAVEDAILASVLGVMVVLAVLQIILRNLFGTAILWGDAMLRVSVLWVGMLGAMAATRDDRQISVDVVSRFLPPRFRPRLRVLTDTFTAAVAGFLAWHAARLVAVDRADGMIAFAAVPVWVCEVVLPFAAGIIAVRYLLYAADHLREALGSEPGA
jgi:TRAP-type C4-dicarboxylate transport system permease small subunit